MHFLARREVVQCVRCVRRVQLPFRFVGHSAQLCNARPDRFGRGLVLALLPVGLNRISLLVLALASQRLGLGLARRLLVVLLGQIHAALGKSMPVGLAAWCVRQ